MDDKISVIIPAYNIADYIAPCLDSILAQSHANLEIIVVDDGSQDDTPAILDNYAQADTRIRVIHKENGGVTRARLRGVAEATGEWIGFVDGDDYVEPDMYERLLKNACTHHADISHCGYQMVLPGRVDYYYNTGRFVVQNTRAALQELLSGAFEPGLVNKLFRRSIFDDLLQKDRMDNSIRINEDLLMNYYLFREAKTVVFEDFCSYHYLVRKGSAANSALKPHKLQDPYRVRKILMKETEGDAELHSLCRQSLVRQLIGVATMTTRGHPEEIKSCIKSMRQELRKEGKPFRRDPGVSTRRKVQATWAALWPESYHLAHSIYGEITGATHKYDLK